MARVPVAINPRSNPTALVRQNLRGPQADLSPITQGLDQLAQQIQVNQFNREKFDLNKRFMEETNELQGEYDVREKSAEAGAPNFAERVQTDYTARHQAIVEEYRGQGYSDEALNDFQLRLGSLRGTFYGKALGYQTQSVARKATSDLDSNATSISQYVTANPNAYKSGVTEFENSTNLLAGSVEYNMLEQMRQAGKKVIREGAGHGLALNDPRRVVSVLAPHLLPGPGGTVSYGASSNPWGNVAINVAGKWGLNPAELAAIFSFESSLDPNRKNPQGYLGLIQFSPKNQGIYEIKEGSSPEEWTTAIDRYFRDTGLQPGDPIEKVYAAILTGNANGDLDKRDTNGTSVRNAVPRILSKHLAAADAWLGQREQTALPTTPQEVIASMDARGKTGIDVLDDMDGNERMQVLNEAMTQMRRQQAQDDGSLQIRIQNEIAAKQTEGEFAGDPVTDAELVGKLGAPKAEQVRGEIAAAERAGVFVKSMKTQSVASVNAQLDAMRPKDTGSPTYKTDRETYEAAYRAAQANFELREKDPASYVLQAYPNIATQLQDPAQRQAALAGMKAAYDQLGTPSDQRLPYPKEMIADMAEQYDSFGAKQKLDFLNQQFGVLAGTGMAGPLAGEMSKTASSLGADSFLYANLRFHPEFNAVMQDVFRGVAAIQKDPARRPPNEAVNKAFRNTVGIAITSLNPDASRFYNEAATALYVAAGGQVTMGMVDNNLYKESLRRAMGGLKGNAETGLVNLHGDRPATILPPGITKQQWNNWLPRQTAQDLVNNSVEKHYMVDSFGHQPKMRDIIDQGVFVMLAPGQYGIQGTDGNFYVDHVTGQPFRVRVPAEWVKR